MKRRGVVVLAIGGIGLSLLAAALPAAARDGHWSTQVRIGTPHPSHWHNGRWQHGWRDGRVGWWWVVGPEWYYYPDRVYPYPEPYRPPVVVVAPPVSAPQLPPPVMVQQAAPAVWYFCEAAQTYYPYVNSCPAGWKTVPAVPAVSAPVPAAAPDQR